MEDLDQVVKGMRKEFGDTTVFTGSDTFRLDIPRRSSGSLLLDFALGGGYPKGRVIELHGKESSGKTLLLLLAIAEAQRVEPEKLNCIFDLEYSMDLEWAAHLGVDVTKLVIIQPDTFAEGVYDRVEYCIDSGKFAYIGIDSVAALVPKDEFEGTDWNKESRVGGSSKINAKAMRKLVNSGKLTNSGSTLVMINQLRDAIGVFSPFGPVSMTSGGRSLLFAYSIRVEVSRGDTYSKGSGDSKIVLGQQIKTKITKNKVAPPYKTATLDLYYEQGIDKITELVNVAKLCGVLQGTSWLRVTDITTGEIIQDSNGSEIKFNGIQKVTDAVKEDVQNNEGVFYYQLMDLVNKAIRG